MSTILLERNYAGFYVSVIFDPESKKITLSGKTNNGEILSEIPPERVMDAFEHPCLYLDNSADLFKKSYAS